MQPESIDLEVVKANVLSALAHKDRRTLRSISLHINQGNLVTASAVDALLAEERIFKEPPTTSGHSAHYWLKTGSCRIRSIKS